ncbi:hypothetical protein BDL97_16G018500 [Sphagnum fallax]|nr:hypothetical protein BDL97_16G018500 [Sphagnum fallax]
MELQQPSCFDESLVRGDDHDHGKLIDGEGAERDDHGNPMLFLASSSRTPPENAARRRTSSSSDGESCRQTQNGSSLNNDVCNQNSAAATTLVHCHRRFFFPEREESEDDDHEGDDGHGGGILVDRRPRKSSTSTPAQHVGTTCREGGGRGASSEHEGSGSGGGILLVGFTEGETDDGGSSLQLENCDKLGTLGLVEGALLRMLGGGGGAAPAPADSPSLSHSLSQKSSHSLSYKDSPSLSQSLSYKNDSPSLSHSSSYKKDSPSLSHCLSYKKDSPSLSHSLSQKSSTRSLSHSLSQKSSHSLLSHKDSPYLCHSLSQKSTVPENFLDAEDYGKLVETDVLFQCQSHPHPEEDAEIAEEASSSSGPDEEHKERKLLSRLLDQVQTLRREKEQMEQHVMANKQPIFHWDGARICASCVSKRSGRRADKRQSRNCAVNHENLRQTVENAAQMAKAAAEAAQAAALSVAKNSTAVELLLQTLSPSLSSSIAEHLERSVLKCGQNTRCRQTTVANDKSEEEENTDVMKNKKMVLIQMVPTLVQWKVDGEWCCLNRRECLANLLHHSSKVSLLSWEVSLMKASVELLQPTFRGTSVM